MQDSEYSSYQPKPGKTTKICTRYVLESRIFNDSETENEESAKYDFQYTCLFKPPHSFADSGVLNLGRLHYSKLFKQ